MAQTASWSQSTTAADTGIVIPANSQIIEISIYITTACAAANVSMGTSSTSLSCLCVSRRYSRRCNQTRFCWYNHRRGYLGRHWTADLPIFIDFSAGTTGRGHVTVEYIQGINNA